MCKFKNRIENETVVIGYKVAIRKDGKYFSPATGIEYNPGSIPIPEERGEIIVGNYFVDVTDPTENCYNRAYIGMTAGFVELKDAKGFRNYICYSIGSTEKKSIPIILDDQKSSVDLIVLRIELTGKLFSGSYGVMYDDYDVYIGSEIKSLEEVVE